MEIHVAIDQGTNSPRGRDSQGHNSHGPDSAEKAASIPGTGL